MNTDFKFKLTALLSAITTFLMPIIPLLVTVGLFILADTITAIYRNKKIKLGFSSRLLFNSLAHKSFIYLGAVVFCFLMEKFMIGDVVAMFVDVPLLLTKLTATTFCLIELKSIDENYKMISGISLIEKFRGILKRAKSVKDELKDFNKDESNN